jgi:hypothetical protein
MDVISIIFSSLGFAVSFFALYIAWQAKKLTLDANNIAIEQIMKRESDEVVKLISELEAKGEIDHAAKLRIVLNQETLTYWNYLYSHADSYGKQKFIEALELRKSVGLISESQMNEWIEAVKKKR